MTDTTDEKLKQRLKDLYGDPREYSLGQISVASGMALDRIKELEAKLAKAVEALQWFIDNDDTNEGDEPMHHRGGMTWNEINAYWIEGLNNGRATLAELKGQNDE